MLPDATDSSGAGLSPAPTVGAPGERRPELGDDAAAPRGPPGGGSWRVPVAVAVLAAVSLSYLGPGYWQGAGGAGPCAVLLRLSLYLGCAAAAFLLGTLFALVFRSPRAPPPDFAAAWRRLAAAASRQPGVSTGFLPPRARGPRAGPPRFGCQLPAVGDPAGAAGPLLSSRAPRLEAESSRETRLGLPAARADLSAPSAPAGGGLGAGGLAEVDRIRRCSRSTAILGHNLAGGKSIPVLRCCSAVGEWKKGEHGGPCTQARRPVLVVVGGSCRRSPWGTWPSDTNLTQVIHLPSHQTCVRLLPQHPASTMLRSKQSWPVSVI